MRTWWRERTDLERGLLAAFAVMAALTLALAIRAAVLLA